MRGVLDHGLGEDGSLVGPLLGGQLGPRLRRQPCRYCHAMARPPLVAWWVVVIGSMASAFCGWAPNTRWLISLGPVGQMWRSDRRAWAVD